MSESSIRAHGKGGEGTMCESEKSRNAEEFIDAVSIEKLEKAVEDGKMDTSSAQLLEAEKEYILAWRERSKRTEDDGQAPQGLTGIALSGGGIRSATFSLGVLQALAKHDLLKQIDYLSTVSGGGYIGSSLTWLTSDRARRESGVEFGVGRGDFPYGTEDPVAPGGGSRDEMESNQEKMLKYQAKMLKFLRQHGNYLTPGKGISLMSGFAIVLRGMLLNLLVWVPLLVALMISLLLYHQFLLERVFSYPKFFTEWLLSQVGMLDPDGPPFFDFVLELSFLLGGFFILGSIVHSLVTWFARSRARWRYKSRRYVEMLAGWLLWALAALILIGMLPLVARWLPVQNGQPFFDSVLKLSFLLGGFFILGSIVYSLVTWLARSREPRRYEWRRRVEKFAGWLLWALAAMFVIGSLPLVARWLPMQIDEFGGAGAIAAGILSGVWAYINSGKKEPGVVPPHLIASVGAALFIYGVLLSAYQLGFMIVELAKGSSQPESIALLGLMLSAGEIAFGLIIFAVALGWFVNLNYISIHRFYRDRLMEAFMPDIDKAMDDVTGSATGADGALLHEMHVSEATSARSWFSKPLHAVKRVFGQTSRDLIVNPRAPYHIVNTNVVLVDSAVRSRRIRGGDSFILSPLYCGSNATGWRPTEQFMNGQMKLATAMAISGAAANPNTGVGGRGVTRSRLVSLLMALLNFRLGYWVSTPRNRWMKLMRPNHFWPGLYEILARGYDENRLFLQLSDGGHFENLGLYELVRRRLKLIIVCDGSADPDFTFSDFLNAVQRAQSDFGVRIEFGNATGPTAKSDEMRKALASLIPNWPARYPRGVDLASYGHLVGTITYPRRGGKTGETGVLIYLKTIMIPGLDLAVLGYKGAHRAFPDETTADQFFGEEQFEAYRVLGYRVAMKMVEKVELEGQPLNEWIGTKRTAFENA